MIKRVLTALAVAITIIGTAVVPASADDNSEFPSCRNLYSGTGAPYGGADYSGAGDWYSSTPIWTVVNTGCEDINITNQHGDAWRWRVRFYPSSGGSTTNSWKSACSLCVVVVATNVLTGTKYRIEGHKLTLGGAQEIYARPVDVAD